MIKIERLFKFFGEHPAIVDLSFEVPQGKIFGFIGPNGAGKTSTMRILATLSRPSSGNASVGGFDVQSEQRDVRRIMGYMPDHFGIYPGMRVGEYLDFFGAAFRIPLAKRRGIIKDVLALTDLEQKRDDFVDTLSQGNKQRVCLAKTLIHDPKVLILDEPASGLDPRARIELRELLKTLRTMGKTVLISSHILSDLADFSDLIGIIERGKLVVTGAVQEVAKKYRPYRLLEWRFLEGAETAEGWLKSQPTVQKTELNDHRLRLEGNFNDEDIARFHAEMVGKGVKIIGCREIEANLEEVFMRVTSGGVS
ncbi:MAG: ABC transporter ATP-binding protein [Verrucomicrobia bacterium]|nr:ABC transporter ATP-binding protein [Verrucomicrobiota bacterium]